MARRLGLADQAVLANERTHEPIRGGGRPHNLLLPFIAGIATR